MGPFGRATQLLVVVALSVPQVARAITDTDSDGMDDGWETTHFGDLSRDGTGDYDGDDIDDLAEHDADLDPTVDDAFEDADGDRYPNIFEHVHSADLTDASDVPSPDLVVDAANGNNSSTDNIYTTLSAAINAASTSNGAYQIVGLEADTYTGSSNVLKTIASSKPKLLIIGLDGAAATILDAEGSSGKLTLNQRTVLSSLTLHRMRGNSPIYIGNTGDRSMLIDLVMTESKGFPTALVELYYAEDVEIIGCTFYGNDSTGTLASGIHLEPNSSATITNSVFWNVVGTLPEVKVDTGATLSIEYSLVRGDPVTGTNVTGVSDPKIRSDGRPLVGSPVLTKGSIGNGSALDMDLEDRPSSSPDIGVDQVVDTDSDGLADNWEQEQAGNLTTLTSATQDYDSDGLDNAGEFAAYTDATDSDSDDDGVSDGAEVNAGSDPLDGDTDDDGMPDGFEHTYGLDPNSDDTFSDKDGDRYPNVFEYHASTSPSSAASIPTPDLVVDWEHGNDSTTDNVYDDLQEAVTKAVVANGSHQIIGIEPGTYTGGSNVNQNVASWRPVLLIIGLAGARSTVFDGEYGAGAGGFTFSQKAVLSSVTLRRFRFAAVVHFKASGVLADSILADNYTKTNALTIASAVVSVVGTSIIRNRTDSTLSQVTVGTSSKLWLYSSVIWNPNPTLDEIDVASGSEVWAYNSLVRDDEVTANANNLTNVADPGIRFDYRLLPSSPLRSAGALFSSSALDMELEARPAAADIGADQYGDADQDGLPDAWEVEVASNTTSLSGSGDADADGLSDLMEYATANAVMGADPFDSDTDDDGLLDGEEIAYGTDPLTFDLIALDTDLNGDEVDDGIGYS